MAKRRTIEEKYALFDTAEECATAAVPVFLAQRWRWKTSEFTGIPGYAEILQGLQRLAAVAEEMNSREVEAGRLVYYCGRFGHERAV